MVVKCGKKLNTIATSQPGRHGLVSSPLEETNCASSAHAADGAMEKIVAEGDEEKNTDEDSVKAWRSGSIAAATRRILLDAPALELRSLRRRIWKGQVYANRYAAAAAAAADAIKAAAVAGAHRAESVGSKAPSPAAAAADILEIVAEFGPTSFLNNAARKESVSSRPQKGEEQRQAMPWYMAHQIDVYVFLFGSISPHCLHCTFKLQCLQAHLAHLTINQKDMRSTFLYFSSQWLCSEPIASSHTSFYTKY